MCNLVGGSELQTQRKKKSTGNVTAEPLAIGIFHPTDLIQIRLFSLRSLIQEQR